LNAIIEFEKDGTPKRRFESDGYAWCLNGKQSRVFESLRDATEDAPAGAYILDLYVHQKVIGEKK
jgi:hypothetical protein